MIGVVWKPSTREVAVSCDLGTRKHIVTPSRINLEYKSCEKYFLAKKQVFMHFALQYYCIDIDLLCAKFQIKLKMKKG